GGVIVGNTIGSGSTALGFGLCIIVASVLYGDEGIECSPQELFLFGLDTINFSISVSSNRDFEYFL
ncbi:hypothetical protein LRN53_15740, partial [Staphylococcus aureus]|uniref:hypothetical protein n=1 Tax=Staphylococcus aureus TaxID=1280 RepID=UPI001E2F3560